MKKGLSIEQIFEIEPRLKSVERYAIKQNELAKNKEIHWHNVWFICKKNSYKLIGGSADNRIISSNECYDTWHDHLYSLTTNCK